MKDKTTHLYVRNMLCRDFCLCREEKNSCISCSTLLVGQGNRNEKLTLINPKQLNAVRVVAAKNL